ncbi:MAG TPA: DUF6603 domain-containing protein [Rhodocyclaceae bacterium]|nr:DUF6603 domain-containing protein [Rhodocyclaceae bacterium]
MGVLEDIGGKLAPGRNIGFGDLANVLEPSVPGVGAGLQELERLLAAEGLDLTIGSGEDDREQEAEFVSVCAALKLSGDMACRLEFLFCVDEQGIVDEVVLEVRDFQLLMAGLFERMVPASAHEAIQPLVEACEAFHSRISVLLRADSNFQPLFEVELWADRLTFPKLKAISLENVALLIRRVQTDQPASVEVRAKLGVELPKEPGSDDIDPGSFPLVSLFVPLAKGEPWVLRLEEPLYLLRTPLAFLSIAAEMFDGADALKYTALQGQLPECLRVLDGLALTKFDLRFDPFGKDGIFHGLDFEVALTTPLRLAETLLIQGAALYVRVGRDGPRLWISGGLLMPGRLWSHASIEVPLNDPSAEWELTLRAGFNPGSGLRNLTLPLSGLPMVGHQAVPAAFLDIEQINITSFTLCFNPLTPEVRFLALTSGMIGRAGVDPFFEVKDPTLHLEIENLLKAEGERRYSGSLEAGVSLAGLPFRACAGREKDGVWYFYAQLAQRGVKMEVLGAHWQLGLPPHLALVSLDNLDFSFRTGGLKIQFDWGVTVPLVLDEQQKPTVSLHLASTLRIERGTEGTKPTYSAWLTGTAEVAGLTLIARVLRNDEGQWKLGLDLVQSDEKNKIEKKEVKREDTVGLDDLMHLFGQEEALPALPEELDFRLQSLSAWAEISEKTYQLDLALGVWKMGDGRLRIKGAGKEPGARPLLAGGAVIKRRLQASQLPLVGKLLPPELDLGLIDPWLLVANRALSEDELKDFTAALLGAAPSGISGGQLGMGVSLELGSKQISLMLALTPGKRKAKLRALASSGAHAELLPAPVRAEGPSSVSDDLGTQGAGTTKWISLQKNLGPLSVRRVGIRFDKGRLGVLVDGAVSVAGLTLEADGLGLSSPLNAFQPEFHLSGLGFGFEKDPILVAAGLRVSDADELAQMPKVRGHAVSFAMSGAAIVRVSKISVAGVGGLCILDDGLPAMFIFGELRAPLGGDPAFFVTGFSGGVGFNYSMRAPRIGEVWDCPFVAGLFAKDKDGKTPSALQVLDKLTVGAPERAWLTPKPGNVWLAGGLRFTTYEMVETNAVALAVIGSDLTFSLMGLCSAGLPRGASPGLAFIEVEFQATIKPLAGYLALGGGLTPRSWLLVKECVLSGTMGACWWLNSSHPDFVISIGGYHPAFQRPADWPILQAVGFNWRYGDKVVVKGGVYGAVTPACVMAGGALDITFQSGGFKAWLKAHADFLMRYLPLSFEADAAVSIGASYDIDFLSIKKTLKVELDASIHFAGPPLHGDILLDLYLFKVRIEFGEKTQPSSLPDWEKVKGQLVSPDKDRIRLRMDAGLPTGVPESRPPLLAARVNAGANAGASEPQSHLPTLACTAGFSIDADVAVPSTRLVVNGKELAQAEAFAVRPIGRANVTGLLDVRIEHEGKPVGEERPWGISPRLGRLATGLWGLPENSGRPQVNGDRHTHELIVGVTIVPPVAEMAGKAMTVLPERMYANEPIYLQFPPSLPMPGPSCRVPAPVEAGEESMAVLRNFNKPEANRSRLERHDQLRALGFPLPPLGDVAQFAKSVDLHYPSAPRLLRPYA